MSPTLFNWIVLAWIAIAIILVPIQLRVTAPYGRHTHSKWGPMLDNRLGWFLMEIISPLVFGYFFLSGPVAKSNPMYFIFGLWVAHYLNRSIIYPLRTRTTGKKIPLSIVLSAAFFNIINGFINGYWLGYLSPTYPNDWLLDPRFHLGFMLFTAGAFINNQSDTILINLRQPGETGYKIPQGGFFKWVSCPNLFGEMLEWTGFALLCWNLPALSFAIWTIANLLPRALSHHQWYLKKFPEYPRKRKAVIPGVI